MRIGQMGRNPKTVTTVPYSLLFLFPVLPFLSKVSTPLGRLMYAYEINIFFAGRTLNRSESLPKDALVGEG